MKTLKFSKNLIPLMLSGEKTKTWRLFDDKDLQKGDETLCLDKENNKPFAKVLLTEVQEKTFKEITEEDKEGHEEYQSNEEMYRIYSDYYRVEVTPDTKLKVIEFRLLEKIDSPE